MAMVHPGSHESATTSERRRDTISNNGPQIIRPRAVKATMMSPRLFAETFCQQSNDAGIPASAAAHAIQQSNEWHRRWILQEEEGHTMPHDANQWSFDRMEGARNPSLSDTESEASDMRSPSPLLLQQQHQTPLLRPVALRVQDVVQDVSCGGPSPSPFLLDRSSAADSPLTLPSSEAHGPVIFDDLSFESLLSIPSEIQQTDCMEVTKEGLLHALSISGGDVSTPEFEAALLPLVQRYQELGWDARDPDGIYSNYANTRRVEGMWLTLSKPTYFGNLGETSNGDPMYTLGRMAFDMFLPTQLVCSLQGNFNPVAVVPTEERAALMEQCPKALREEIGNGSSILRKYDIVTAFTIEPHLADYPNAPNKDVRRPIKGIMTTYGYVLPDPTVPNRLSIFFTGGRIEPNDDAYDQREWKRLFSKKQPSRSMGEQVRLLAASVLMGAEAPSEMNVEDGSLEFSFSRPLGGHGVAYVDVIYLDDTFRVVRGHRGTIFCFVRVPDN